MRKIESAHTPSGSTPSIDEVELENVTGGCAVGGCCSSGGCAPSGGYTYRQSGGIDPMFMLLAMSLFSNK
jgi:hypothetical protein